MIFLGRLKAIGACNIENIDKLSSFRLIKLREISRKRQGINKAAIEINFASLISLAHGLSLLQIYGIKTFYNYLIKIDAGQVGTKSLLKSLQATPFYNDLKANLSGIISAQSINELHPKFSKLLEILLTYFNKNSSGKAIIFSSFRDSVEDIAEVLHQYSPKIRASAFLGQKSVKSKVSDKKNIFNQKKQVEVGYNYILFRVLRL